MRCGLVVIVVVASSVARGAVDLGTPFADGVVLQRGCNVPVWGKATPKGKLIVSFAGRSVEGVVRDDGGWMLDLPPMEASKESRTLTVEEIVRDSQDRLQTNKVEVGDVLVGEVWLCSGQSNADCPIWGDNPRFRDGMGAMSLQMTKKPFVRLAKTPHVASVTPRFGYKARWKPMSPEMFSSDRKSGMLPSAMGWYFALELANSLDIPIGLVDSSWGGTNIDAWTPRCGYEGIPELSDVAALPLLESQEFALARERGVYRGKGIYRQWIQQPSALWNGMVAAYVPMACRGVIWYQGCHNIREYQRYCLKMHALYNGWSRAFGNEALRIYFVQLAPWGNPDIAKIQMEQARFAAEEKNAGMAVANDVGNLTDIHPNDKRTVAKRLAVHALRRDYGWSWVKDNSPTFRSMRVDGDRVILTFSDAEGWYLYNPKQGDCSNGFEIAGADGEFKSAEITNIVAPLNKDTNKPDFKGLIEGCDLVIRANGVAKPRRVRYLHSAPWFGGLYNEVGLPLGAFEAEMR